MWLSSTKASTCLVIRGAYAEFFSIYKTHFFSPLFSEEYLLSLVTSTDFLPTLIHQILEKNLKNNLKLSHIY